MILIYFTNKEGNVQIFDMLNIIILCVYFLGSSFWLLLFCFFVVVVVVLLPLPPPPFFFVVLFAVNDYTCFSPIRNPTDFNDKNLNFTFFIKQFYAILFSVLLCNCI